VVTLLFGVSEWLSYRHITALLDQHAAILADTTDHTVALERLRYTRDHALLSVTSVRILYAAGTLLIAVAVLNLVWYRTIYRPIRDLLKQINIMGRGTWKCPLPVRRDDEIGELTTAFNELGRQLTSTFEHINASSKLSALALIGGRLVREVTATRNRIVEASRGLRSGTPDGLAAATANLDEVENKLTTLEGGFQAAFDEELSTITAGATAGSRGT
jgi:methyl-accepting chemotaxis protein